MVAIAAVKDVLIGLTANGMVLSAQPHATERNNYADLHDVIAIEKSNRFDPVDTFYHDKHALLVFRADGTVILCGLDGLSGIRKVLATDIRYMYINADGEKSTGTSNCLIGVGEDGTERTLGAVSYTHLPRSCVVCLALPSAQAQRQQAAYGCVPDPHPNKPPLARHHLPLAK